MLESIHSSSLAQAVLRNLMQQHQQGQRQLEGEQLLEALAAALFHWAPTEFHYFLHQRSSQPPASSDLSAKLLRNAEASQDEGMLAVLLGSGLLRHPLDRGGQHLSDAVQMHPRRAGLVRLLLQHGVTACLEHINMAIGRGNRAGGAAALWAADGAPGQRGGACVLGLDLGQPGRRAHDVPTVEMPCQ